MFLYPKFDSFGKQIVTRQTGKTAASLQDITVYQKKAGARLVVESDTNESAILLLQGEVTFCWQNQKVRAVRRGVFLDPPTCLHIPKGVKAVVKMNKESEVLVQSTPNERAFLPKLYQRNDLVQFVSCEGNWDNTAVRDVVTIFDYNNAPHSNLVIGEVYARQGRWWSYIPHNHPQPEVYYYKFDRPEGFGACFDGETAHTIKDKSAGLFEGGNNHQQVTAPGYPMYCCWMIRHLDGDPWKETRTDDPRYSWLLTEEGKAIK